MIGQRPSPTSRKYHHHGSGFHGSPVEPRTRSDDRSCAADRVVPVGHERPDHGRREAEVRHAVARDQRPQPVGLGKSGAPS